VIIFFPLAEKAGLEDQKIAGIGPENIMKINMRKTKKLL